MSNILASYVEKFILNPGTGLSGLEDDDNEVTKATVSDRIEGEEGSKSERYSISKLRTQNAELLGDVDSRYEGKKITRKELNKKEVTFDPDLAKLCFIEDNISNDSKEENSDSNDSHESPKEPSNKTRTRKTLIKGKPNDLQDDNDDYMRFAEEIEEESGDESDEKSEGSDEEFDEDNESIGSNYSENEEDDEAVSESDEENEIDNDDDEDVHSNTGDIRKEENTRQIINTFSRSKSDQAPKGAAVKNQCYIYDTLFETRIGLQKVVSTANQLPQHYSFEAFLKNDYYPQYKENLISARKSVKNLINEILKLQESLLLDNSETSHILKNDKETECNEDDESENEGEDSSHNKKGKKRKLEEFEKILTKRQKNIIPFRDETLNKWHEKSKLLTMQSKSNFDKFEVPPVKQLENVLSNKDSLVKKTQLLGLSRGNVYKILGKNQDDNSNLVEEYDAEIFDDSDFYSRMLEDVLKSKISVSDDMTEVSRRWVDIQKLRKKAKKKVDTKASKGKKLRYDLMSKLQNFLAPCKFSHLNDEAQNQLFSSLFCKF